MTKIGNREFYSKTNHITLDGNEWHEIPYELVQLVNLTNLYIINTNITKIPKWINELSLTSLSITKNNFNEIPQEIFTMHSLKKLDMSHNNITKIPTEIKKLTNIRQLWLTHNKIKILPKEITDLTNLSQLRCRSNEIMDVYEGIYHMKIVELFLSNNNIKSIPLTIVDNKQNMFFMYSFYNNPLQFTDKHKKIFIHNNLCWTHKCITLCNNNIINFIKCTNNSISYKERIINSRLRLYDKWRKQLKKKYISYSSHKSTYSFKEWNKMQQIELYELSTNLLKLDKYLVNTSKTKLYFWALKYVVPKYYKTKYVSIQWPL